MREVTVEMVVEVVGAKEGMQEEPRTKEDELKEEHEGERVKEEGTMSCVRVLDEAVKEEKEVQE